MSLTAIFSSFIDFLYPRSLLAQELEALSPPEMLRLFPPAGETPPDTIALFSYSDTRVRAMVHELKYRRDISIAKNLAILLSDVLRAELTERAFTENFNKPLLVPMPMSDKRLHERGWNQTEVLSQEIKNLDSENFIEYRLDILKRVRHSESQTKISRSARFSNVRDSVEATSEAGGRCVVVLDDVLTTGATFGEAKRALRQAGALKVLCLAIAH